MFDRKKWVSFGINVADLIFPQIHIIESVAHAIPKLSGQQKQDAVIELVKQSVSFTEDLAQRDLLDDAEVEKAVRGVVDAIVAFQNIVAKKAGS